jgi:hypothetical protein
VCCAGVLQLSVVRPLLQGHFNTGFYRWHRGQHTIFKQTDQKTLAQQTGALISNTNALFPVVLAQLLAPGVAMLAWGFLLWDAVGWRRPPPLEASPSERMFQSVLTDFLNPNKDLMRVVAGASGLAATMSHTIIVLGVMSLCRVGVLQD